MQRKIGTFIAWAAATLASIALATSAVSSVRDEVTNQPSPLSSSVVTAAARATTAAAPSTSVTTSSVALTATSTSETVDSTSVASSAAPATTSPVRPATTIATPSPTTTTTTTTDAPSNEYFKSYQLVGGWVRLRIVGGNVYLKGAVPSPGYSLKVDKDGPDSVEVEFDNGSRESKLHAEVSDGELKVETEEE